MKTEKLNKLKNCKTTLSPKIKIIFSRGKVNKNTQKTKKLECSFTVLQCFY